MHSLGATNDGSDDSRSPASRRERLAGMPTLPAKRLQPRVFPLPNTVADDRRNVIGDVHCLAGTCSGSGSGAGIGSGLGSAVGSSIGSSRGSTMMVRSGSPICMCLLPSYLAANESRTYTLVTNAPRLNSTAQGQQIQQVGLAEAWSLRHQHV